MGRVDTFIGIGMAIMMAVFCRRLAVDLLAPGTPMYEMVASASFGTMDTQAWSEQVYVAAAVYVPWLLVGGSIVIGAYREFLRQNVTQAGARR